MSEEPELAEANRHPVAGTHLRACSPTSMTLSRAELDFAKRDILVTPVSRLNYEVTRSMRSPALAGMPGAGL
jgi:hypothetical protein